MVCEAKKWNRFLTSLPEWERKVIEQSKASDPQALKDPPERLMVVSNGGVKDGKGAFRWVAGTSNRAIVAKGEGMVWGNPMTSYRAKACGKLALICFIWRFIEYHGVKLQCKVQSNATTRV
jgi:hypothetical protein